MASLNEVDDYVLESILRRASASSGRAYRVLPLVCGRWYSLCLRSTTALTVLSGQALWQDLGDSRPWPPRFLPRTEGMILDQILQFPNLRHLTLSSDIVDHLSTHFFQDLTFTCSGLRKLSFGSGVWTPLCFTSLRSSLDVLFSTLPCLVSLSLPIFASDVFRIPDSLSRLTLLTMLDVGTGVPCPGAMQCLVRLRRVVVFGLDDLRILADLRLLPALTSLQVSNERGAGPSRAMHVPEALWQVSSLRSLSIFKPIMFCTPGAWELRRLTTLHLTTFMPRGLHQALLGLQDLRCLHLDLSLAQELPHAVSTLVHLSELCVKGFCVQELPQGLCERLELKKLKIKCSSLQHIPQALQNMSSLTDLFLEVGQGALDDFIWTSLTNLQKLCVETEIHSFHASLFCLPKLEKLQLLFCPLLKDLALQPDSLPSLLELDIGAAPQLQQLPDSLGCLSQLSSFALMSCSGLRRLPLSVSDLQSLAVLRIDDMLFFEGLEEGAGALDHLKVLHLSHLLALEQLPETVGCLSALEDLQLLECKALRELPKGLGSSPSRLRKIWIRCCPRIEALPVSLEQASLDLLQLECLDSLTGVPVASAACGAPRTLIIRACPLIRHLQLAKSSTSPARVQQMELRNLPLSVLPLACGGMSSLLSLGLWSLHRLTKLTTHFGKLCSLRNLHVCSCSSLVALPASLGSLSSLEALTVANCPDLLSLPKSVGDLTQLQALILKELRSLVSLPATLGNLSALRRLVVENLRRLAALPHSLTRLTSLEDLCISGCRNLVHCPVGLGSLPLLNDVSREELLSVLSSVRDNQESQPSCSLWKRAAEG